MDESEAVQSIAALPGERYNSCVWLLLLQR